MWLRGTNVTGGYYKMPEVTAKDFDKDGWFHTGDIGNDEASKQTKANESNKGPIKNRTRSFLLDIFCLNSDTEYL